MATESDNSNNFWRVGTYDKQFWDNYLAARPRYQLSDFYQNLYTYHDAHSGDYGVAHDIGTGPGQVAHVLASKFDKVIASDTNEPHLVAARQHHGEKPNIEYILSAGEEISNKVEPGSCDAVYVAEAIPLMDKEKAMSSFGQILKPNGTLGIWFYGRPFFADGDREACSAAYSALVNIKVAKMLEKVPAPFKMGLKHGYDTMASQLDDVAFPADTWSNVERHKWNMHAKMVFSDQEAMPDMPIVASSKVDETQEKVIQHKDEKFWGESWDATQVHNFIKAIIPVNQDELEEDPEIKKLVAELQEAMGGEGSKRSISWPVILLLATKK